MSKQFQCEDKVEAKLPGSLFYSHGAILCEKYLPLLLKKTTENTTFLSSIIKQYLKI